jgi:hypothetical protein
MTPHAQSMKLADVDFPLPKYRTGQTVYRASVSHETEMLPCPDCLGTAPPPRRPARGRPSAGY